MTSAQSIESSVLVKTPAISFRSVDKFYGDHKVLKNITFDVEKGEKVVICGPSGSGKSTLIRCVNRLETHQAGEIRVAGVALDQTTVRSVRQHIGMVFQSFNLFPHLTIEENCMVAPMSTKRMGRADARALAMKYLSRVRVEAHARKYPSQLSGGQQQRVALARALAQKPKVLLLDEPLSALDAKIRVSLREEIRALQRALGITTIFVTHDQEEALSMSDRVVVMNEGRAEQVGTPFEVYNNPETPFVANFVGTLSVLKGKVLDAASGRIQIGKSEIVASRKLFQANPGDACSVALRPEAAVLENGHGGAVNGAARNRLEGTIDDVAFLGSVVRVRVKIEDNAISLDTFNNPSAIPPQRGAPVVVSFTPNDVLVLDGAR
jgi:putative spermidine/putrescine transport system ATP-binding protein